MGSSSQSFAVATSQSVRCGEEWRAQDE